MTTPAPKMLRSRWLSIRRSLRGQRFRPLRQIGPGVFQATDGTKYQRTICPAQEATKANTRLWPHRKARKAKPDRLNPMVTLNGRPHYSKDGTKLLKRRRNQLRALEASARLLKSLGL